MNSTFVLVVEIWGAINMAFSCLLQVDLSDIPDTLNSDINCSLSVGFSKAFNDNRWHRYQLRVIVKNLA
jgi:hypothetical protein